MRVLNVDLEKKKVELTLKELIVKNKKKMPTTFEGLEHGKRFSGIVVGENDHSYQLKFFNNLKGFLRLEDVQNAPQKPVLTLGSIVDVFYLFKTEQGIAVTLDEKLSVETKGRVEKHEIVQNSSISKLLLKENEDVLKDIKEANKGKKEFSVGKIS